MVSDSPVDNPQMLSTFGDVVHWFDWGIRGASLYVVGRTCCLVLVAGWCVGGMGDAPPLLSHSTFVHLISPFAWVVNTYSSTFLSLSFL